LTYINTWVTIYLIGKSPKRAEDGINR